MSTFTQVHKTKMTVDIIGIQRVNIDIFLHIYTCGHLHMCKIPFDYFCLINGMKADKGNLHIYTFTQVHMCK